MSQKIYPNQLSQIQKRLWYVTKLDDDWATYNQPMTFILKGKLNIKALETAFQVLVDILNGFQITDLQYEIF